MTREEAKKLISRFEVIKGYAEGKTIQFQDPAVKEFRDNWTNVVGEPSFLWEKDSTIYRIKPERTLRPWKPEEIPVGKAVLRIKGVIHTDQYLITARSGCVAYHQEGNSLKTTRTDFLLEKYEHSLDNGKTWLPCGVYENE